MTLKAVLPVVTCLLAVLAGGGKALSADLGRVGEIFEIEEPNFLEKLYERFAELEAEGAVDQLRDDMIARTKSYVFEPRPVEGVIKATEDSVRYFDPSITVQQDLKDHRGVIFARKGTVVNPLDHVFQAPKIIMIDGSDPVQVEWSMKQGDETNSVITLIRGRSIDLSNKHGRRFWFDQDGVIAHRFEITAVPSVIEVAGRKMKITEVKLP